MTTPPATGVSLRALDNEQATAIAEGQRQEDWHSDYPTEGDVIIARYWLEHPWEPAPQQVLHEGKVVGGIGTKGPNAKGEVEIGYGLIEAVRGRRIGSAAIELMLELLTAHGFTRVVAETEAANGASQRLLLRAGFTVLGENAQDVLFQKRL